MSNEYAIGQTLYVICRCISFGTKEITLYVDPWKFISGDFRKLCLLQARNMADCVGFFATEICFDNREDAEACRDNMATKLREEGNTVSIVKGLGINGSEEVDES